MWQRELNTRLKRLSLVAGYAGPPGPNRRSGSSLCISMPSFPATSSSSTASTWAVSVAPRDGSGSTPASTWPAPSYGPRCSGSGPLWTT